MSALKLIYGQQKVVERAFSQKEVSAYVTLVGDSNPIHTDLEFAKQKGLERTVVPGGLITETLVAIASSEFPSGAMRVSDEVRYRNFLYVGDEAELRVQVDKVCEGQSTKIIRLSIEARKGDTTYLEGTIKALYKP